MIEYYDNTLCIEAGWLIDEGIMTKSNYKILVCGNSKQKRKSKLRVLRRGCLNTPALVDYDSIPTRFRTKIIEKIGNDPHKVAQKSILAGLITTDLKAKQFFAEYLDANDAHLKEELQEEYCVNASVLNAIHTIITNPPARQKAMGKKRTGLWPKLAEAVQKLDRSKYKHSLPPYVKFDDDGNMLPIGPTAYRKLQDRYNRYISADKRKYDRIGYESLIHGNTARKNAVKITDEAGEWLVARWSSMVDRVATEKQLWNEYNRVAANYGWKHIKTPDSIHNYLFREDVKYLWWAARYGDSSFTQKFAYQHKTILPSMRDSLWYSDGTKLNYFFQYRDAKGHFKIGTTSVYEIMDTYSECFVGYHISDSENFEAQYNAYRMALQFSECKPYQITYDNQGGHKKLEAGDFLNKLSRLNIRTRAYNGKSKTIENAFYRYQAEFLAKDWFFTGQNIQSKELENKANMEFIMANKHNLPTREEVEKIYKKRRNEWQNSPHPKIKDKSRIEVYRESENPKTEALTLMDMVDLFWVLRPKTVKTSAYGINFEEKGEKLHYMVMDAAGLPDIKWLVRNIDKDFRIKFDPNDRTLIYLYEETPQGLRFVSEAVEDVRIHRGKQEQEDWEMKRWHAIEKEIEDMRIELKQELLNIQNKYNQTPEQHGLNTPKYRGEKPNKKKSKQPAGNFGKLQKALSNVVPAGVDDDDFDENDIYNLI
jgi:hypothetical protein